MSPFLDNFKSLSNNKWPKEKEVLSYLIFFHFDLCHQNLSLLIYFCLGYKVIPNKTVNSAKVKITKTSICFHLKITFSILYIKSFLKQLFLDKKDFYYETHIL